MTHEEKLQWMALWAANNGLQLVLEGECGFGRECVGVSTDGHYPDYHWYDEEYNQVDENGDVWIPEDAYHKHECLAVLGRGEQAEAQLYDWLKWFDDNGFKLETGDQPVDPNIGALAFIMGKHRYARMVRSNAGGKPQNLQYNVARFTTKSASSPRKQCAECSDKYSGKPRKKGS